MKYLLSTLVILYNIICFSANAQTSKLYFEHINTTNGLSNNRIYSIIQDKKGFLWIATLDGLTRYDGYLYKIYKTNPEDTSAYTIHNNRITNLYQDKVGNIWLGTEKNGVEKYDPVHETFTHYPPSTVAQKGIPSSDVVSFSEKPDGTLLIKFTDGVCSYNSKKNIFIRENTITPIEKDLQLETYKTKIKQLFGKQIEILSLLKEPDGIYWIGTSMDGLFIAKNGKIEHYTYPPFDALLEIRVIYRDKFGVIWIGTRNNGLFKHNPSTRQFKHYNYFENASEIIPDLTVRAITEDHEGNIWVGTYNNGIIRFDRTNNSFTHYKNSSNGILPSDNMIRSLFTDREGNIWIGSYAGISVFNVKNKSFSKFAIDKQTENQKVPYQSKNLFFNRVYGFSADNSGNIWIANWNALSCFNPQTKIFKHYPAKFFGIEHIRKVYVDNNNIVWIGGESGGMAHFNPISEKFERYYPGKSSNNLVYKNVFDIYEDHSGYMWIATFNGLDRFDKSKNVFHHFFTNNGLSDNMVYGILDDTKGNLWFPTTNGISKFNPIKNEFLNYDSKSGLMTTEFAEGGFYKSKRTGEFIMGGINGFLVFNPDSIKINRLAPEIVLTGLKIMNQPVLPQTKVKGKMKLTQSITYTHELILNPEDNIVTFEFAALHFVNPEKNHYRYKLEGFEQEWVTTDYLRRSATYTNLRPGKYIFKVQAANSDNIWNTNELSLTVIVLPPFWLTWWAFIFYAALIVLIVFAYRQYMLKELRMKNALLLERLKHEKSEELNLMKMNFFTNISHEFRSPLTLILAPLEKIMKAPVDSRLSEHRAYFETISKNANRLMELTNQVMELRKLETGNMQLKAKPINMNEYIENIIIQFNEAAKQKEISLNFNSSNTNIEAWIDTLSFDKIIYNLLSNALKFTPEKTGILNVWINVGERKIDEQYSFTIGELHNDSFFEFSVEDNGIGIPSEIIYNIFNQFYRVENQFTVNVQGSGVGLAILKELVLLYKGQVLVKSTEGKGSIFTIRIPLGNSHLLPDQIDEYATKAPSVLQWPQDIVVKKKAKENTVKQIHTKTLLIVEDNEDLCTFMENTFAEWYNVLTADNGRTGTSIALTHLPDLIISDIAMPQMSGIELCKRLKNDIHTSHIPIILLTAKTSDDNKLEGFSAYADDYIEKPFSLLVLKARVESIIENREKIKKAISEGYFATIVQPEPTLNPLDDEFMHKLNEFIEINVADINFNVENMSRNLGMSRSSLHLKLKALTGLSATEYIRNYRLNVAVELLNEKRLNVVEISYKTGFNSPSYFIKCFKEKFGVTPKEYIVK